MTRILLQFLNAPLLLLIAGLLVGAQTSLFAPAQLYVFQPDVLLLFLIWVGLKRDFTEGGILTLILGEIAEVHSSGTRGLLLIQSMTVFLIVRACARLLALPRQSSWILLTLGLAIFSKFLLVFLVQVLGLGPAPWRHTFILLFPSSVTTSLLALVGFRWLDRFDFLTFKSEKARQSVEDELQIEGEGY
jgi:cell shape-determining protein MreD